MKHILIVTSVILLSMSNKLQSQTLIESSDSLSMNYDWIYELDKKDSILSLEVLEIISSSFNEFYLDQPVLSAELFNEIKKIYMSSFYVLYSNSDSVKNNSIKPLSDLEIKNQNHYAANFLMQQSTIFDTVDEFYRKSSVQTDYYTFNYVIISKLKRHGYLASANVLDEHFYHNSNIITSNEHTVHRACIIEANESLVWRKIRGGSLGLRVSPENELEIEVDNRVRKMNQAVSVSTLNSSYILLKIKVSPEDINANIFVNKKFIGTLEKFRGANIKGIKIPLKSANEVLITSNNKILYKNTISSKLQFSTSLTSYDLQILPDPETEEIILNCNYDKEKGILVCAH